ncbi:5'-3' exonuclease family protein [Artemisia annua]|uniref:5'-3' exonuclease family protein n=1 Tax=Artemisia annua TaxID=35608 RepID=A0A2U1LZE4_ARTAN|nr:5'-3' exonuclease family protein [Artemisia annua]
MTLGYGGDFGIGSPSHRFLFRLQKFNSGTQLYSFDAITVTQILKICGEIARNNDRAGTQVVVDVSDLSLMKLDEFHEQLQDLQKEKLSFTDFHGCRQLIFRFRGRALETNDWAAANGYHDLVRELLGLDSNHLIKLSFLSRIRRLELVWDDGEQFEDVAKNRSLVAQKLLHEGDHKREKTLSSGLVMAGGFFLFGAKCIIKSIKPNSQEPFECYEMSDIEAGLGLKRKHITAIALLVENDHDLKGDQEIGLETALSFVKSFSEDEVLDKLCLLGSGNTLDNIYIGDGVHNLDENLARTRCSHCSLCGHPGSKRSHLKDSCEHCSSIACEGCMQKPIGFKCDCLSRDQVVDPDPE